MRSATGLTTVIDVVNRLHYRNPLGKLPNRWVNEVGPNDTPQWMMKALDPKTGYEKPRKASDEYFKTWAHNSTIFDRESAVEDYLDSLPVNPHSPIGSKDIPRLKYDIMKYNPYRKKKVKTGEDRYHRLVPESDLEYKNRMNAEAEDAYWDIRYTQDNWDSEKLFRPKFDESKSPFDFEGKEKDKKKPSGKSPFGFRYAQNRAPFV